MLKLLAIDPSLNRTGIAYADGKTETIEPPKSKQGLERLVWLRDRFWKLLDSYNPQAILLEDYSYGSKGSSIVQIAEWGGVLRMLLHGMVIPVTLVPPASLKLWATGKGNADKTAVLSELVHRAGRTWATTDEAEAWGLLSLGYGYLGTPLVAMPSDRKQAWDKIRWHPVMTEARK